MPDSPYSWCAQRVASAPAATIATKPNAGKSSIGLRVVVPLVAGDFEALAQAKVATADAANAAGPVTFKNGRSVDGESNVTSIITLTNITAVAVRMPADPYLFDVDRWQSKRPLRLAHGPRVRPRRFHGGSDTSSVSSGARATVAVCLQGHVRHGKRFAAQTGARLGVRRMDGWWPTPRGWRLGAGVYLRDTARANRRQPRWNPDRGGMQHHERAGARTHIDGT